MTTLSVLGVGKIGGEVAYLSTIMELADELIVYDSAAALLKSQVLDLSHTGIDIGISTDWREVKRSDICIFAAGLPRNQDVQTRADLLNANLPVASECSSALRGFGGILITVTNPMDANNYYLCRKIGLEPRQCIGFGGQLDSARFGIALRALRIGGSAWVIGEHGEHQVPLFSRLDARVSQKTRDQLTAELRGASMEVIRGKGGTVFGPAYHIAQLIRIISRDERALISCSCVLDGEYGLDRCSLAVPARVGKNGVLGIEEWSLDPWEQREFDEAGRFVAGLCSQTDR